MTDRLAELIRKHEGIRLTVYDDYNGRAVEKGTVVLGHPTIGIGRLLTSGRGISPAEALMLLDNDLVLVRQQVAKAFPWAKHLTEARQDVLHSMCFQLGIHGLTGFAKMIDACRRGDYAKAAYEMTNSKWHDQTPKRCSELAAMMLHGEYTTKETI